VGDLAPQPSVVGLELQDHRNPGEVEALTQQRGDLAQPLDVGQAVEPGAARRALRIDQTGVSRTRAGSALRCRPCRRRPRCVGDNVDLDKISASYHDGVLALQVPVAEKAKPRKIAIEAGDGQRVIEG